MDGERQRERSKTFAWQTVRTKTQAMAALEQWRAEVEKEASAVRLVDYARDYIAMLETTRTIEPSTAKGYRRILKEIAALGNIPLDSLTPAMARRWETALLARGLHPTSVGAAHRLLKQVCKHAVEDEVIPSNPLDSVKPPKRRQSSPNALDSEGRAQLMAMLSEMGSVPIAVAATIALCTGMRRGEVCALMWRDIDLERAEIRVCRSVGVGEGGEYVKEPKTPSSRRTIPIPPLLVDMLARLDRRGEYVLGGDSPYNASVLTREWGAISKAFHLVGTEGRPCTFHDLRHTYATMAIAEGADVKSVSSIMGHANAAMTLNVYASADVQAKRRAADIVGRSLMGL